MRFMFVLLFVFLIIENTYARCDFSGKVINVIDGDTIVLKTQDRKIKKIRLAQIDAPEMSQKFGSESRKALADEILGKNVNVLIFDIDQYRRTVGTVIYKKRDINRYMIKRGYAYVYTRYMKDSSLIVDEVEAKLNNYGLWSLSDKDRIKPWKFRKINKHKKHKKTGD